ncbi:hypothetical protein FQN55_005903 [Onygenales sp. PD_40]|nr:hypothetical protein FQN55_005903 [Onygenales sp. PD_40]
MPSPDIFQFPQYRMLRQKHIGQCEGYCRPPVPELAIRTTSSIEAGAVLWHAGDCGVQDSRAGAPTIAIMMTLSELLVDREANDLQLGRRKSHTS